MKTPKVPLKIPRTIPVAWLLRWIVNKLVRIWK